MATTDQTKKRKRQTSDELVPSSSMYDPPKQLSSSGLFDPSMVTIQVSNQLEDPDWIEAFTIPLELLSARSPYFKGLFEGGFAESKIVHAVLRDVSPWLFRVVVGWLYHQTISYDSERKTRQFKKRRTSTASAPQRRGSGSTENTKQAGGMQGGDGSAADLRGNYDGGRGDNPSNSTTASMPTVDDQNDQQDYYPIFQRTKHNQDEHQGQHPPGGNDNKYAQTDSVEYGASDTKDECNYREPVTWPWLWLFELYIFADKHDIRDFRMKIFEIVQLKMFQTRPRYYPVPSTEDIPGIVDRLMPSSPLYRFLVDCYAKWYDYGEDGQDRDVQAGIFDSLPAHFLSRCLIAAMRSGSATDCDKCNAEGTPPPCRAVNHVKEDRLVPCQKDSCYYHEHGDDQEGKARCVQRWKSLMSRCIWKTMALVTVSFTVVVGSLDCWALLSQGVD